MAEACDHEFIDNKNCLKCGVSFASLKAGFDAERLALASGVTNDNDETTALLAAVCGAASSLVVHWGETRHEPANEHERRLRDAVRAVLGA